ncbi:hypothetical protein O988_09299 [Pseudogymnoascus sp. VKM F-3808]|nr:hypothetical protein O988_09299 [Pseudogymnoascus sp. VKM F-3808]
MRVPGESPPNVAGQRLVRDIRGLTSIALLATILRVVAKIRIRKFRWDDILMVAAQIFGIAGSIIVTIGVQRGLGQHVWHTLASSKAGPDGDAFYTPPELPADEDHGALIWFRHFTGSAALSGGRNALLLYTQVGVHGDTVATSGYIAIPNGDAPEGGWPIVTWAHGTTGIADQCAPTRSDNSGDQTTSNLLEDWISKGYAVVNTDYEGLGTPGDHPYLIGNSEGRAVLDIIRAARTYQPKLNNKVVIAGHSQGGQAALFAALLAPTYTPELELFGTIAFAPVSNLENELPLLRGLSVNALSGTVALILRGLSIANSSLDATSLLTPTALALYPETLTKCSTELSSNSSFGPVAADDLLLPSTNIDGLLVDLEENDASFLKIQKPLDD